MEKEMKLEFIPTCQTWVIRANVADAQRWESQVSVEDTWKVSVHWMCNGRHVDTRGVEFR